MAVGDFGSLFIKVAGQQPASLLQLFFEVFCEYLS